MRKIIFLIFGERGIGLYEAFKALKEHKYYFLVSFDIENYQYETTWKYRFPTKVHKNKMDRLSKEIIEVIDTNMSEFKN